MKVRPGAVIRGVGVAAACLASSPAARPNILFAAYAAAWPLGRPGLQVLVVVPDTDEPWKRGAVPFPTSVASWSFVMLVAATALRRTFLPVPVAAVLLGGDRGGHRLPPRRPGGSPRSGSGLPRRCRVRRRLT